MNTEEGREAKDGRMAEEVGWGIDDDADSSGGNGGCVEQGGGAVVAGAAGAADDDWDCDVDSVTGPEVARGIEVLDD